MLRPVLLYSDLQTIARGNALIIPEMGSVPARMDNECTTRNLVNSGWCSVVEQRYKRRAFTMYFLSPTDTSGCLLKPRLHRDQIQAWVLLEVW